MIGKGIRLFGIYRKPINAVGRQARQAVMTAAFSGLLEGASFLMLVPLINALALDDATPGASILSQFGLGWMPNSVQALIGIFACLVLALSYSVVSAAAANKFIGLEFLLVRQSMSEAADALFRAPWLNFQRLKSGQIEKALLVESRRIALGSRQLLMAAAQSAVALLMLAFCLLITWQMTLLAMCAALIGTYLYLRIGKRVNAASESLAVQEGRLTATFAEVFQNFKFFRLWGNYLDNCAEIDADVKRYCDAQVLVQTTQNRVRMYAEIAAILALFSFLGLGLSLFKIAPGNLIVFLGIFYRLVPRVLNVNALLLSAEVESRFLADWENRIIGLGAEPRRFDPRRSDNVQGELAESKPQHASISLNHSIELVDVTLKVEGQELLSSVGFKLAAGEMLVLFGESGAGKSTLLDVISALIIPTSGKLLIDGKEIEAAEAASWQASQAHVLQVNPVLSATVAQNVAWGEADPDLQRVREALQSAQLGELLSSLEHGLDTVLGKGARELSGGESQRLAIARALYRRPALIIMDEPTSALDAANARNVISAIAALKRHVTLIIATHSVELARHADRIISLSDGRIAKQGAGGESGLRIPS